MDPTLANDILRTVLHDLPVGVIVQGPEAEIRYANQSALRLLGLTMDQLLGKTSFDPSWDVVRLDGSPFPNAEHPAVEAIRTRQSVLDVLMGVRRGKLGDRVWLLVSALPRLDDLGNVNDVLVSFSDVTTEHGHVEATEQALRLAERRMQEQSELLAATFRAMSEGVVLHGPDGSIVMSNRAAASVLGITTEQLTGRSPLDPRWGLVEVDGTPLPPHEIPSEITRHTGNPVHHRVLGVNVPNRGRSWLAVTTDPVRPEEGEPHHVVATFTDISELRDAELALQQSEARLARVTEAVPGVIFEIERRHDQQWTFSFLSGQVEEVLGLPAAEVRHDPLSMAEVLDPQDLLAVREALRRSGRDGTSMEVEVRIPKNDADRWIRIWARPESVPEGLRYTGFVVDVTHARLIQDRMRQAQRREAMASLAAGVAHNFNNMLGAIVPNLDYALEDAPPDLQEPLQDALTAATSASELVRQLLFASRGEGERPGTTVSVNEVVAEVHSICRSTFDPGICLELDLDDAPLTVRGSASLLQQVALNLLINARDAVKTVERPKVRLAAHATDDERWVVLDVVDNGIGMTADVQARLGEPFFTTKAPGQGTGLGLASVYGIVSDLDGRIEVRSTPGEGASFRVLLPHVAGSPDYRGTGARSRSTLSGRRVLVIDDEPLVRRAVRRMLERRDLVAIEASSGSEGLERLDDTIDAVLLDLSMPGMSGDEVLPLVKDRWPEVPVAIVTGHVDGTPGLEQADIVLHKPIDASTLITWLRTSLGAPPTSRDHRSA